MSSTNSGPSVTTTPNVVVQAVPAGSPAVPFDPSSVAITGGTIGGAPAQAVNGLQRGLVGTIAALGDSRAASTGYFFTAGLQLQSTLPRFVLHWLNYYLGSPWKFLQSSTYAVAGTRTDQWAQGQADILALATPPDFVFITFPTNDIQQRGNITQAQTFANLDAYINAHLQRGSRVILSTAGCNTANTASKWADIKQTNDWIRAKAKACNCYLVDTMTPIADAITGQMVTGYGTDGTHENALAAQKQAIYNVMQFLHEARRGGSRFQRANLWETAAYNPNASGGTTNPTSWSTSGTAGTRTKVARTDIPGEFARVAFTSASDTEEAGWAQTINFNTAWAASTVQGIGARVKGGFGDHWVCTTAGTTGATQPAALQAASTVGDTATDGGAVWTRIVTIIPGVSRVSIAAEVVISGATGGVQPRINGTFGGAAGDLTFFRSMSPNAADVSAPCTAVASDIVPALMTPTVLVPADATSMTVGVTARVANGITANVDMGRVLVEVS